MYIIYSVDMKILTFFITNLDRKIYPASTKITARSLKKKKNYNKTYSKQKKKKKRG